MKFIEPQIFWLLPPVAAAIFVLAISAARRRRKKLEVLLGSSADDPEAVRVSAAGRRWRIFFLLMAAASLICAASRPFWGSTLIPWSDRGRDIMVIFDVSKSMLAADPAPSRLEHAKFLLRELTSRSRGDRFALAAFAGSAYLACPFTADTSAFDQYVDELSPDMIPVGGTNIENALRSAMRAFESAGNHRAVILFSDGEELTGNSKSLLEKLKGEKVPIFVVGLGDPATATPLPDEKGNLRRDAAGKIITSRTNEAALSAIAAATGGKYIRSTVTDNGLNTLIKCINTVGTAEFENGKRTLPVEKFPLALISAGIFMLLWLFTSEAPARRKLPLLLFFSFALMTAGAAETPAAKPELPAELPAVNGKDSGAATETPLPEDPAELYNLALEKQRQNDTAAAGLYEKVIRSAPPELQAKSLFNLGAISHSGGRSTLQQAVGRVSGQDLDGALQEIGKAEKEFNAAEELYAGSLTVPGKGLADAANQNINMLSLDRKAAGELKKKIEELKKQQRQAQQQAKQAQQQNQQKDQQKQGGKQQKQDQKDQENPASQTGKAQKSAEELSRRAAELGQDKLAKDAADAARELEKAAEAQAGNRREEARKHLDEAVKKLGDPADGKKPEQNQKKDQQKDQNKPSPESGSGEQDSKLPPAAPRPSPAEKKDQKPEDAGKDNAAALLQLLDDEEKQLRDALRERRRSQRPAVEKDW